MYKIAVDAYGGDNAPNEIVKGCLSALEIYSDITILLCGKEQELRTLIANNANRDRIEIVPADEVITNDEVPTTAIRQKKNSSLVKCIEVCKQDEQCIGMTSAGSTGAVLTGGVLKLGRISTVSRPALAPVLPTLGDGNVILIDCGANVDCKPFMLVQFAQMGSAYAKVLGVRNPRVALLSNGTEDKKGNEFSQQAFALLKECTDINFCGNMEARDILSGAYDVVVADGFYGNIALKACEGAVTTLLKMIKSELTSGFVSKIGALLLRKSFKRIKSRMDYNEGGGALFVGLQKILVKGHGSAKAKSVCGSIGQIRQMYIGGLNDKIASALPKKETINE